MFWSDYILVILFPYFGFNESQQVLGWGGRGHRNGVQRDQKDRDLGETSWGGAEEEMSRAGEV